MIALVEGAKLQRTPNEMRSSILLSGLRSSSCRATATLRLVSGCTLNAPRSGSWLVALLALPRSPRRRRAALDHRHRWYVDRVARFNALAMSGRAGRPPVPSTPCLTADKTGTITFGNRLAARIVALPGDRRARGYRGRAASRRSRTRRPRGARSSSSRTPASQEAGPRDGIRGSDDRRGGPLLGGVTHERRDPRSTARRLPKGAVDAIRAALDGEATGRARRSLSDEIAGPGATPLAIRRHGRALGIIELRTPRSPACGGTVRQRAPDGDPGRSWSPGQPADRKDHCRRGLGGDSSRRRSPRTRSTGSGRNRRRVTWWR